ncbi:TatD family hydrolase [Microbulbifer sp. 2201CG32-9]|uniref:TatD family hydrolase n=1 Tax=Microbulbifer sp. 2201CG32-9 TaxID=3232309 RepID=UPI00345BA955
MLLIDSHCHFDFDDFTSDRDAVWQRCRAVGVEQLIIPGVEVRQWESLAALVCREPGWHAAVGVHPWWISGLQQTDAQLQQALCECAEQGRFVAIGECGLDKLIETPFERQLDVLRIHLTVAAELGLPVILHVRKAHSELLRLLKGFRLGRGGVIHAFSGDVELARRYWAMGFRLGIGGTISYPRAAKTRRAVVELPLESLLLESDAPDMPLRGRQGERNSPEYLPVTAGLLAELRGVSAEEVAARTRENTRLLFSL